MYRVLFITVGLLPVSVFGQDGRIGHVSTVGFEDRHLHREARPDVPAPEIPRLSTPENSDLRRPFWEWQHVTDDWFGARPRLDDAGVIFDAEHVFDWSRVLHGGLNNSQSAFRQLANMNLTLDTQRLGWWDGGVFLVAVQNHNGPNGSDLAGDLQTFSNIDADGRTQASAVWFEQTLFDDRLRIKLGKMDANEDFAFPEHGVLFLQSSMGFSPTIFAFPSYPDPATAIAAFWQLSDEVTLGYGLFDGALSAGIETGRVGPETFFDGTGGLFHIAQVEARWSGWEGTLNGRGSIGGWFHSGRFDRFDGSSDDGTSGLFMTLDHELFRESSLDADWQGLAGFMQYGLADGRVSPFEQHIGGGLTWTGALPTRDQDVMGVGVSWVRLSQAAGAGFSTGHETSFELFYQAQITGWMKVVMDVQYIDSPGGLSSTPDALVSTIRTIVNY